MAPKTKVLQPSVTAVQIWHARPGFATCQPHAASTLNGSFVGRRLNGFLGLSLNDRTILFLVISLDKTVSVR